MTEELISIAGGSIDDVILLETTEHGTLAIYWCESCNNPHHIGVTINGVRYGHGASWDWNGRVDAGVTFSPSQLMRSYRYQHNGTDEDKSEFKSIPGNFDAYVASRFRHICHTFIGINGAPPGHIIWLNDCFQNGKPAPMCGQVRGLLARKDWPGENHGRSWAKVAFKVVPPPPDC